MNPSSSTIVSAFDEKLPTNVPYASNETYRTFRSSVTSTINSDVVKVYLGEKAEVYNDLFDRYFPRVSHGSPLSSRMPVLEGTHLLGAEADVLRLSTLQLLHPVNIALERICPRNTRIICRTEASTSSTSRVDVEWSLYDTNGARLCRLAILEMKNTKIVHKDDFKHAAALDEKDFESKMYKALKLKGSSLLRDNGIWLSKQARKYSEHCPYVAVFDWDAMFLFSFLPLAKAPVRGFYFDERGRTGGMTFRRLLFAFVARPLKRYEIVHLQGAS